ncbi:MAG: septal ring lytic transglycosylase RlpA family protein [Hyphomicrobium sp.]|nr:septal ring lytic transglycosylase RlpA family protein [Hyphomicrobium sp.]
MLFNPMSFVLSKAPAGRNVVALRRWCHAALIFGLAVVLAEITMSFGAAETAEAKTPGKTYCFYKTCHRVKTLAETERLIGTDLTVVASHYDDCKRDRYNPCGLTSSGERFRSDRPDNAASPILPDGTIVLVWSPVNNEAAVIRINNAGPYWGNRKLDLSRATARRLGIGGVGKVRMRVLQAPTREEARYRKNRTYAAVPGSIGPFASLEEAVFGTKVLVALGVPGTDALRAPVDGGAFAIASAAGLRKGPLVPAFQSPDSGFKAAIREQELAEAALSRDKSLAAMLAATPRPLTRLSALDDGLVDRLVREELSRQNTPQPNAAKLETHLLPGAKDAETAKTAASAPSKSWKKQKRIASKRLAKRRVAEARRLARERRRLAARSAAPAKAHAAKKAAKARSVAPFPFGGWTSSRLDIVPGGTTWPGSLQLSPATRILPSDPGLKPDPARLKPVRSSPSALA